MRKTTLTILAASLIVGATVQTAGAAQRHTLKSDRARVHTIEQFRNANGSLAGSSVEQQDYSYYTERHGISAPAGQ